jgi:hypothetical protein
VAARGVPPPLDPVVVVVDELGLPPTSALCVPFWLPASEKLLPESEVDQVVVPPLLLPLALLMEATILVMGVVSVDIVFDCTCWWPMSSAPGPPPSAVARSCC